MTKISEEHAMVSYIKKQRRINHKDCQNCLVACFLLQIEPKKVTQALQDPSWIEAMQDELPQFSLQKVWRLVDLPKGKHAIGTKWVYRNKKDKRGIVVRNKARVVTQGYTQEEGIDYDEVFAHVARIEAIRFGGVTDWYQSQGYREPAVMSSASSAVTYTSVYTDSEPGRPHDPDYVPEPMYPEYIQLEDEHVFPAEEQLLPPVVSPTAESPGYVVESDPKEDPEEYEDDETEDGHVDYPMDGGEDGDDDDNDSPRDDADDEDEDEEDEDEEDEEEEEEHLAFVLFAV
ncbi:putative ribonuclease H-like domain-containing protein [Tanacetum coccineum]